MSPQSKRPKPKRQREADQKQSTKRKPKPSRRRAAEADADDEEDEDDEDEQPTGRRQAKDYGVTGEQLQGMRDDGMGWLEIMEEVGAKSAIPLRKILHAYQAEQDEDFQLDPDDPDAIVAARDEDGLGWGQIAARAGITVAEAKSIYTEAGGENLEGRAYRSKDGTVHFKLGSTSAASEDDEDEDEEYDEDEDEEQDEGEDEDEDEEQDEPAPKPRSKRRPKPVKEAPAKRTKAAKPRRAKK
jgi:hypothetical protein